MKKYIHSTPSADKTEQGVSDTKADAATPAPSFVEPKNDIAHTPVQPKKEKNRALPDDEALFEFDEIAFDDVLVPEPEPLTPEEEELADELREKFGVSDNVGIAFIDGQSEEEVARVEDIEETEVAEAEDSEELEFVPEAVEDVEAEDVELVPEEVEVEDSEELGFSPEMAEAEDSEELEFAPEATENEDVEVKISVIPSEGDEPEQVVFDGIDLPEKNERPKRPRSDELTSSGVQITFLDTEDDGYYYGEGEPEQIFFGDGLDDSASEDDEEEFAENGLEAAAELEGNASEGGVDEIFEESTFDDADLDEDEAEDDGEDEFYPDEYVNEDEDGDEAEMPAFESVSEAQDTDSAEEIEQAPVEEIPSEDLTELGRSARELEAMQAESKALAENTVETATPDYVWDEAELELYKAKKKYMDFCDGLVTPPTRATKDSAMRASAADMPVGSGYRYADGERLPLFEDGRNGGKSTEGYKNREMQHCNEREEKRSAQMLERLRVSGKRLMFSVLILLAVVICENIGVFFADNPDALLIKLGPTLFGIIETALLIAGSVMIFDALRDGIKRMLSGEFILESLTACVVIPSIIYHTVISFAVTSSPFTMLFGTSAALSIALTALYKYNTVKRDYTAFTVASSYGEYLTDVQMADFRDSTEGMAFGEYVDEDASLYKMNKTSRIDGCYSDNVVKDDCFGLVRTLIILTVFASVCAGVVFGFLRNDVLYGVLAALSLISFACPVSAFVAVSMPRARASVVSAEQGGAIIKYDDSDIDEDSVIMLEDGELFPANLLSSSNLEIYSDRVEAHLARTLALVKRIGGPIAAVFNNVEGTVDNFESIRITEISEHGIQAKIDGRPICAGNESFMQRLGIKISRYDKLLPKNGRVMYIADDGVFFARLILIFKPDATLVQRIAALRNTSTVFSLKTCNPCIDRELVFYTTGLEPDLLRVVKYEAGDDISPAETDREGRLASVNGAKGLLTALLEYKRQKKLVRAASVFACFACGAGAIVSLLTSAIGVNFGFSSLLALGLHGGLSLIALLLSRRSAIDTKTKIKKK